MASGAGRVLDEAVLVERTVEAAAPIANGLPATQMPAFGDKLKPSQVQALAQLIYTSPATPPVWGAEEIIASQVVYQPELVAGDASTAEPVYAADPLNLFLVVEAGDHHVSVLDGDKLEPIHRFKSRYALHGGPKFSSDGRFVYFASRDGWISKFDMYRLETVAEVRAGINTRNAAVSADDRFVMVGNTLPHSLVLLDARDLSLVKLIPVQDAARQGSRVSAVYTAPPRSSFVVALKDLKEGDTAIKYGEDIGKVIGKRGVHAQAIRTIITALGIVGLASFNVSRRTRQIGIRRALGATKPAIVRYFLVENTIVSAIGLTVGGGLAIALNIVMVEAFSVEPLAWYVIPVGMLALWLVGQIAVAGPARRASNITPAIATRSS